MLPSLPVEAQTKEQKNADEELMPNIHRVMRYSNLDYFSVLELPCDVYMAMLRNSVIDDLNKTEEGRDYLKKCERLKCTEADIDGLRELQNEVVKNGKP